MCVCVGGGGGGSRRYNHSNIYTRAVLAGGGGGGGGGGGQWLQMHFTLTTRVGICVRYITMEMSTDVEKMSEK